jgi:predicted transcriptional regulator
MLNDTLRIFFARSKLRLTVLKEINKKPQIASFLAKELNKHREVISRIFLDLQKQNLAKCQNPKNPHFRYYEITNKGKEILKEFSK